MVLCARFNGAKHVLAAGRLFTRMLIKSDKQKKENKKSEADQILII